MRPPSVLNFLMLLMLALLTPGTASAVAAQFSYVHAVYSLKRNGQAVGHVDEIFQRNGTHYRIVSKANAEGIAALLVKGPLRMVSEGRIDANGLRPSRFERQRNNKTVSASFDWNKEQLTSTDNGTTSIEPLAAKTQDRLSAMYQFMFAQLKRDHLNMPMTNGKKAAEYVFRRGERGKITTPAGIFETLKTTRESKDSGSESGTENSVELWLATKLKYLPVRLKIREDGALYEQDLVKLETR